MLCYINILLLFFYYYFFTDGIYFFVNDVNFDALITNRYTPEQQEALVSNVFLTGGNMQYPGMKERVERELLAMRPFQSQFKVQPVLS